MAVDPSASSADGPRESGPGPGPRSDTLRFAPAPPAAEAVDARTLVVVLDTTWAGPASPNVIGLRELVAGILAERDLIAEAYAGLDGWADAAGMVTALTIEGTSFWYGTRLEFWMWLLDELLWLAVVDASLRAAPGAAAVECANGTDAGLVEAAGLVARRDGLAFRDETAPVAAAPATALAADRPTAKRRGPGRSLLGRIRWRVWPPRLERRRRSSRRRLARLAGEGGRPLVVVQAHVRQRIETATGRRDLNPYIGPVAERLRGTRLDPVEIDIRGKLADVDTWSRLRAPDGKRSLPFDIIDTEEPAISRTEAQAQADAIADRIAAGSTPLVAAGVDLGPALTTKVATRTRRTAYLALHDVPRIRAVLRRLKPAGILLADEYHRQDWLAAAAAEGIPSVAIQHGVIYRWHTGYIHQSRPAALRLPDRTYVFGPWERDLLTTVSAYRPDEVRVGGSPRLDLVDPRPVDREAVRRELGVASGDRLVVLSGTWGRMYRRFHYPIALADLFRQPASRIHLVVKLHPSERDEGPYRRIIEAPRDGRRLRAAPDQHRAVDRPVPAPGRGRCPPRHPLDAAHRGRGHRDAEPPRDGPRGERPAGIRRCRRRDPGPQPRRPRGGPRRAA